MPAVLKEIGRDSIGKPIERPVYLCDWCGETANYGKDDVYGCGGFHEGEPFCKRDPEGSKSKKDLEIPPASEAPQKGTLF